MPRISNEDLLEKIEKIVEDKFMIQEEKLVYEIDSLKEINRKLIEVNKALITRLNKCNAFPECEPLRSNPNLVIPNIQFIPTCHPVIQRFSLRSSNCIG